MVFRCLLLALCAGAASASPAETAAELLQPPVSADLRQVIDGALAEGAGPQVQVYRWDRFPRVLIVDSASFSVQDRLFTRLAYFLEKRGHRGHLLSNTVLTGRHGWNAHDYGASGLADFFNAAAAVSFPLNPEEIAVRELSLREGILVAERGGYAAGGGAILGICRSSSRVERELLLTHESFHGVFFTSEEYRRYCQGLWDSLSPEVKTFYERFLDSLGYDIGAPTLVVNEFQAYLMQQPLSYTAGYFQRFLSAEESRGRPVPAPWQLLENAQSLDGFTREHCGFGAGGPLFAPADAERAAGR